MALLFSQLEIFGVKLPRGDNFMAGITGLSLFKSKSALMLKIVCQMIDGNNKNMIWILISKQYSAKMYDTSLQ